MLNEGIIEGQGFVSPEICKDLKRIERECGHRLVSLPPRWIGDTTPASYTQVGHKLRFSLVLINDSCVVQVRNSTLLLTLCAIALLD